jgi:GT2 family glycosyltransferase
MAASRHQDSGTTPRSIGVVICSHQRPDRLDRCLAGLAAQRRRPDEVLIVVRDTDARTQAYLRDRAGDLAIRAVTVAVPGLIAARKAGFAASVSDIIAMTDDDAVASDQWIERIFVHFSADPRIGGVGGRDRCHDGLRFDDRRRKTVGKVQWFGRVIGNHHLGYGAARDVDLLKGANMSFRREAVATHGSDLLRGKGAQPHEDAALSWAVRRAGWRLVYDPQVLVEHYVAEREEVRHYASQAELGDGRGFFDHCFNLVVAIWGRLPWHRQLVYVLWSGLIGTTASPGIAQAIRYTPAMGADAWRRFLIAQRAQIAAYRAVRRQKRTATATPAGLPPDPAWR